MAEEHNAKISSTHLGPEGHGILTASLQLEFDGGSQGFGGWNFGAMRRPITRPTCGEYIRRVLDVVGVETWEQLPGKHVRVRHDHQTIFEIGHLLRDEWFSLEELRTPVEVPA